MNTENQDGKVNAGEVVGNAADDAGARNIYAVTFTVLAPMWWVRMGTEGRITYPPMPWGAMGNRGGGRKGGPKKRKWARNRARAWWRSTLMAVGMARVANAGLQPGQESLVTATGREFPWEITAVVVRVGDSNAEETIRALEWWRGTMEAAWGGDETKPDGESAAGAWARSKHAGWIEWEVRKFGAGPA